MTKSSPSKIDQQIGSKLKLQRLKVKVSLKQLGDVINVSFQQIQKYERGLNKISSCNLFLISKYLGLDVGYFFEDLDTKNSNSVVALMDSNKEIIQKNKVSDRELVSIIKHYASISNSQRRKSLLEMIKTM